MKARIDRLKKLEAFLRDLPTHKFNLNIVCQRDDEGCGTLGCAIGWTPAVFPELVGWTDRRLNPYEYSDIARELFGLTYEQALVLFAPGYEYSPEEISTVVVGFPDCSVKEYPQLKGSVTPKEVADRIAEFCADYEAASKATAV